MIQFKDIISPRLKRNNEDDVQYDTPPVNPLQGLGKVMYYAGTGKMLPQEKTTNGLDEAIKRQRLLTGDPDFQMKLAQTKANAELENTLAAKQAEVEMARKLRDSANGGGSSFGITPQQNGPSKSFFPTQETDNNPQMIPQTTMEWNNTTMRNEPVVKMVENKAYKTPKMISEEAEALKAQETANELARSSGLSQLQAIRGAKKGKQFFGAFGGELPSTLMGFPNPLVGTSYPFGSKISDRTDWEANLENLSAQKMLDTMMKMKEASKTGATGFGQLSEKEGQVLRDASMKLRRNLSPEQAQIYLDQMEAVQMKALGMELSPEQQMILDQINSGTYPSGISEESSVPSVGGTFQGKPIKTVRRIG